MRLPVFISRWLRSRPPLLGAPAQPRQKTYSAQSGYVYQYHFAGRRPATVDRAAALEYVFRTSADRRTSFDISIYVLNDAVRQWEQEHGRELSASEVYAIAKLSLFQAFDERSAPSDLKEPVVARAADVAGILQQLDRE